MNTDWSEFWPSMIATFAGFVLALLGQLLFERAKERSDAKELLARIVQELTVVKGALMDINSTQVQIDPLNTPAWDAAISAGQVSLLKPKLREKFFLVYDAIREFNSWNLVQTNYYFSNMVINDQIKQEIEKIKKELLCTEQKKQSRSIEIVLNSIKEEK